MKTKYTLIAITLLYSFCKPLQAQSDSNDVFGGLQSTLTNSLSSFDELIDEGKRLFMLFNNDIQMIMKSETEFYEKTDNILGQDVYYREEATDNSLFISFDWDNKSQVMVGLTKKSGFDFGTYTDEGKYGKDYHMLYFDIHEDKLQLQYTDKDGYWYVPVETESGGYVFVKFDIKQTALSFLKGIRDLALDINVKDMALAISTISGNINLKYPDLGFKLSDDFGQNIGDVLVNAHSETIEQLEKAIRELLKEKYKNIEGFPIFIHWAFMYSPNVIKAKFTSNIKETKIDLGDGSYITRLTVTSGPEKDKFMVFDEYNRLVYIDSGKDGTAEYFYDKDITVTLPHPSYKLEDIMSGKVILPKN